MLQFSEGTDLKLVANSDSTNLKSAPI